MPRGGSPPDEPANHKENNDDPAHLPARLDHFHRRRRVGIDDAARIAAHHRDRRRHSVRRRGDHWRDPRTPSRPDVASASPPQSERRGAGSARRSDVLGRPVAYGDVERLTAILGRPLRTHRDFAVALAR
ncbi:hypothetical protein BLAT2472_20301 [Burkholderia latens]